jgi:hypothetical protein
MEAAGTAVSITTLQQALPHIGRSTLARHWASIRAERETAQASGEDVATAVLEPPRAPDSVPETLQAILDAEARLEAARAHLETLKRDLAPALQQRVFLLSAWQQGVITRADAAWGPFDAACGQIQAAEQRITRAEQDVTYATQQHSFRAFEGAAAEVALTAAGRELLAEIAHYEQLYAAALQERSSQTMSWSMARDWARERFKTMVNIHRGLVQPKVSISEEQSQQMRAGEVERMQAANPARGRHHY